MDDGTDNCVIEKINQEKVSNISISDFTKKVYKARSEVCIKMYLKSPVTLICAVELFYIV
jgi:hypothetical protein